MFKGRWSRSNSGGEGPSNFSWKPLIVGAATAVTCLFTYAFGSYQPEELPESVMEEVGFDPATNRDECPQLNARSIETIGAMLDRLGMSPGQIRTGAVDLSHYLDRWMHFYIAAAHCGNAHQIAASSGLSVEEVLQSLTSPEGMIATWAGCMMAGGASIHLTPEGESVLKRIGRDGGSAKGTVIGRGDLTSGYDLVELSNPQRSVFNGATMVSFQARTMYFHALSGTVLHILYVSRSGDMYWIWVGAGGRGFTSRFVNNPAAIHMDLGIWTDMGKSIKLLYADPNMVKKFASMNSEQIHTLIRDLVISSQSKKGTFRDVLQRAQVTMGYPSRVVSSASNMSITGVKGTNKND